MLIATFSRVQATRNHQWTWQRVGVADRFGSSTNTCGRERKVVLHEETRANCLPCVGRSSKNVCNLLLRQVRNRVRRANHTRIPCRTQSSSLGVVCKGLRQHSLSQVRGRVAMKPQSTIGGDRLTDPRSCANCGRRPRLPTLQHCGRCYEYLKPLVRAWARKQNPIPGEDIPEC
jgi:hypothetical protein